MIIGIGIDLVLINRFESKINDSRWLSRVFSQKELCSLNNLSAKTLASRFAAKEAVFKALGMPLSLGEIRNVEIFRQSGDRPYAVLSGDVKNTFDILGASDIHISISHEKSHAIAIAIINKQNKTL